MTRPQINIFKRETNVVIVSEGQTLMRRGDAADYMYVVQEGELEARLVDGTVVETIGPGGIVGEMALVDGAPRTADIVATKESRLVPLDEQAFMNHVHRTPFFALQVLRITVERLRSMMARQEATEDATASG